MPINLFCFPRSKEKRYTYLQDSKKDMYAINIYHNIYWRIDILDKSL